MNSANTPRLSARIIRLSEAIERKTIVRIIRDGLVTMIPILMIGAFALILQSFPLNWYQELIQTFAGGVLYRFFHGIYVGTFGVMSVYMAIAFSISYFSVRQPEQIVDMWGVLTALICFLILDGIAVDGFTLSSLGAVSVFLACASSIAASDCYLWLHRLSPRLKTFAYGADSRLNSTLNALFPSAVTIALTAVLSVLVTLTGKPTVYHLMTDSALWLFSGSLPPAVKGLFFMLLSHTLWFFGIHGSDCLESVSNTLFVPLLDRNVQALAAGQPPVEILSKPFFDCFILMGGCGSTLCLLLAILLFCKDRPMRDIAKTAAFPMLFNINELMVFGLPIVFNPILFIPFVTVPIIQYIIAFFAFQTGLVPPVISGVAWTTPIFLGGYAATGSLAGSVLQAINLLVGTAVYLPFVKMQERIRLDRETSNRQDFISWYQKNERSLQGIRLCELRGIYGEIAKSIATKLRTVVENEDYRIFYQPQFDYENRCVGVEALLRYPKSEQAIYPPLLIHLAKEYDILESLERDILRRVLEERPLIYRQFGEGITISVNVTGTSISSETYWIRLEDLCRRYRVVPGSLCIEITEQDAIHFDPQITARFHACRAAGIRFAIDDFSMGETSVHYLKEGLFDCIKLDGSLVKGMVDNPRCCEIAASIIQLSQSLQINTVAEYVETEQLRSQLHEIGCDWYQGYLYSPAVPLKDSE